MNAHHNMPIVICFETDGSVQAHCPLLPNCQCKSPSRAQALRTMQQLIKHALSMTGFKHGPHKYEVVHLAVSRALESIDRSSRRPRQSKERSGATGNLVTLAAPNGEWT